jgi:hypothetical protein
MSTDMRVPNEIWLGECLEGAEGREKCFISGLVAFSVYFTFTETNRAIFSFSYS